MKRILFIGLLIFISLSFVSADDCFGLATGSHTENCNGNNYCVSGYCCGDNSNETYVWQKMGNCDMAQNDTSRGVCVTPESKGCAFAIPDGAKPFEPATGKSCWLSNQAAGYNNQVFYYDEGEIMGSDTPYFDIYDRRWTNYHADWYSCVCENNVWVEAGDSQQELCESEIGVAKTLTYFEPVPENVWMNNFCCGDDCFEFYRQGNDGTSACCKEFNNIVIGGICYNPDGVFHDVSAEITSPSNANTGESITINADVENLGTYEEEIVVNFYVDNILKETKTINLLKSGISKINFIWKATEGIHNLLIKALIGSDKDLTNNEDDAVINVTTPPVVYFCSDSDGGLNYNEAGKASLQVSATRIRSYKDSCKNNPTNFFGNFDNNIGPGGGPVVKDKITPYLYEAFCKDGKPAMVIKECSCLNGKCI